MFQPFQRLDSDRVSHPDGHGLGLAIVRGIAIAHNARLTVGLRPGGGLDMDVRSPPPGASAEPARTAALVRRRPDSLRL